jgi:hypothetical protein
MYFCTAKHMEQADLYHTFLIVNYNCLCGYINENAEHYLLHCNRFTFSRIIMLFEISLITKKPFEKYLATEFKQLFKNNKTAMMQYASLFFQWIFDNIF